jgi:predicted negative regulator of RcsB-dependent stress response
MRTFLILCWLTIPFLAWAYHVGPGQQKLQLDEASQLLRQAKAATASDDFASANAFYAQALSKLPDEQKSDGYAIRLAMAKIQLESNQLPEARGALETLLSEIEKDPKADSKVKDATRETLAFAQYYMTWLMRLEGKHAEEWEPEIESSRQHYRLLAESAEGSGDATAADRHKQDLEATIRLARMDLSDLQALKIPSQCKGCCSGNCKKVGKPSPRKSENKGGGANEGPLQDGSGS